MQIKTRINFPGRGALLLSALAALWFSAAAPPRGFCAARAEPVARGNSQGGAGRADAAVKKSESVAIAKDGRLKLNFPPDTEISEIVKTFSQLMNRDYILDDKVRGKITIISRSELTVDEAYEVFQSILKVKGFTIVPAGKAYKIVPAQQAMKENIETLFESADPGDRIVTRIVPLKFVDAESIAPILRPLTSGKDSIVAYAPTNTLIMIDANSNIERILEILDTLDIETPEEKVLKIIPLRFASADTMASTLLAATAQMSSSATPSQPAAARTAAARRRRTNTPARRTSAQQGSSVQIIADSRTNSLIIIAPPDDFEQIEEIIAALDVRIAETSGKINVYYLKYADAENVASVLTAISKSAGDKKQPTVAAAARRTPTPSPTPTAQATRTSAQVPAEFEEPVMITADKTTNSLVIIASLQDFEILKGVIQKLDIRRPQVLVEALIVEMSYDKTLELGIEWKSVNDISKDQVSVFGGTNFGEMNSAMQNPFGVSGLFIGAADGTISIPGVGEFLNLGALVRALQANGDGNVLSTPHLLTTDNEEAEIVVSDNIPFQTSEKFDSNGNPIYTFDYRDVGLTLRLTPQINEDNFVKLKIFQEISQVKTITTGTANAPSTTKRSAKTTVVAKNGTTVVIGGLIKDNTQTNISSVPCLGDLPLIGALFRKSKDEKTKTNLLIFLTPHIINTMKDMEDITKAKRLEFKDQMDRIESTDEIKPETPIEKMNRHLDDSPLKKTLEYRMPAEGGEDQ